MDRRRNPRVKAQLPVRIWGVDAHDLPFMQLASVKNLSSSGFCCERGDVQIEGRYAASLSSSICRATDSSTMLPLAISHTANLLENEWYGLFWLSCCAAYSSRVHRRNL